MTGPAITRLWPAPDPAPLTDEQLTGLYATDPAGLRVIASGRPDPPIPADVGADHPLRSCRVRPLEISPHATRVTDRAQDELDEVLATDNDRHDGLGLQVLGLVTASGGGLDRRDLQQLTGRPAFEIDRLLRGVFGRTIAGRADRHNTERVFLFTHETLRVQALDRLGPGTLAGFAERLHTWAAGYQQRGWPADTPGYLLRGYPRMLTDARDLDRLVGLATDPTRHHRMLDTTGGDAAAMTEIATALALLSAQAAPDLLAALRLAWYRDQFADRNSYLPTVLPAVWATLRQPIRAEALARSFAEPYQQAQALRGVVAAVAAAGNLDHARALADAARRADHGRGGDGRLQRQPLAPLGRAGRHAAPGGRPAVARGPRRLRRPRAATARDRYGRAAHRLHAGGGGGALGAREAAMGGDGAPLRRAADVGCPAEDRGATRGRGGGPGRHRPRLGQGEMRTGRRFTLLLLALGAMFLQQTVEFR